MHSICDTVLIASDEIPRDLLRDRKIIRFRVIIRFGLTAALKTQPGALVHSIIITVAYTCRMKHTMHMPQGNMKTSSPYHCNDKWSYLLLLLSVHVFFVFSAAWVSVKGCLFDEIETSTGRVTLNCLIAAL